MYIKIIGYYEELINILLNMQKKHKNIPLKKFFWNLFCTIGSDLTFTFIPLSLKERNLKDTERDNVL